MVRLCATCEMILFFYGTHMSWNDFLFKYATRKAGFYRVGMITEQRVHTTTCEMINCTIYDISLVPTPSTTSTRSSICAMVVEQRRDLYMTPYLGAAFVHPSTPAPVIFDENKKIVKLYEKIWKILETHTYKFFILVNFLELKRHPLCSVKKRKNEWSK